MHLVNKCKQLFRLCAFPILVIIVFVSCFFAIKYFTANNQEIVTGYYSLAVNLKTHHILSYPGSPLTPTAYRAPLYPAFLYAFAGNKENNIKAAFAAQLILFVLTILLILHIVNFLTKSVFASLVAVSIYSFHPVSIKYVASFGVEFFYGFVLLSMIAVLLHALDRKKGYIKYYSFAFVLIGISITCKSPMALFPLVLAFWFYFKPSSQIFFKRTFLIFLFLAYMVLSPWILRNAKEFHEFIPFERYAAFCNIYTASKGMAKACLPAEAHKLYHNEGKGNLYSSKVSSLTLIKEGMINYKAYFRGLIKRVPLVLTSFPFLFIFSILGLWLFRHNPGVNIIGLLVGYFILVHLLFSFESHYLIPVLPLFAILASMPIGYYKLFSERTILLDKIAGSKVIVFIPAGIILATYFLSVILLARETLKSNLKPNEHDAIESLSPGFMGENAKQLAHYYNKLGVLDLFSNYAAPAKKKFSMAIIEYPGYADAHLNLAYTY
ncbi:MAG: glycosyltransferase family 39 protein, partial [Elusimicrobiales bacterium]|nr:glycosyltransferase family 39 protein [Elusimicrobiales bacterium]